MRHSIGLAWVAAGFLVASAAPLSAQSTVQRARDVLNDRTPAPVEPVRVEPARVETGRTTIIVPRREVLIIEPVRARDGWWKQPKYHVITVYYDGTRFYRAPFDRRVLRKVVVYQYAGRYYIDEPQWRRDHRRYYHRDYDGWRDNDRRRYDDRWEDNRRNDDDKWKDNDRRNDDDRWKDSDKRNEDDKSKDTDKRDDDDKDGSHRDNGRHLGRGHDKDKDKDQH
jgi:hypothetical protein